VALAVLPPLAVTVYTVIALMLGAAGLHPMWKVSTPNFSEAAAGRDAATVMLLLSQGRDPNASHLVRAGVLDRWAVRTTPLEAAFGEGRMEIVDILLRNGAALDEKRRIAFTCQARARREADIVRYFEARGGPVTCEKDAR
jgi:ankyrin repeat protein